MKLIRSITIVASLFSLCLLTGCENNKTARNTGVGAAAGAIMGGVIGHQSGHAGEGAAIGAAAGAAGGYGYSKMKEEK